jgi:hypothetical protein
MMTTLTIELPDRISQQIRDQKISPERLENMIINWVEAYLQARQSTPLSETSESMWTDSKEFAQRVIAKNRALFEELARLP